MKLVINLPDIEIRDTLELLEMIEDFGDYNAIPLSYFTDYSDERPARTDRSPATATPTVDSVQRPPANPERKDSNVQLGGDAFLHLS